MLLLVALVAGCRTTSPSTKQVFFQRHPELRERYVQFYETSLEAIDDEIDSKAASHYTLIRILLESYPNYPDLVKHLEVVKKRWESATAHEHDYVQQIRREFDPGTDAMFFFRYIEGDNYEFGWLILRRGEIYKKFYHEGPFETKEKKP